MYIKVQDRRDIIRDGDSKAILNINNDGLAAYRARRQREQTMDNIVNEVSNLKADMGEIKFLLSRILEKNNDN
jgi:hypothetical protein